MINNIVTLITILIVQIGMARTTGSPWAAAGTSAGPGPRSFCFFCIFVCLFTLLDLCASSLRRGHANLLCIVPILTDDPRRESIFIVVCYLCFTRDRACTAGCSLRELAVDAHAILLLVVDCCLSLIWIWALRWLLIVLLLVGLSSLSISLTPSGPTARDAGAGTSTSTSSWALVAFAFLSSIQPLHNGNDVYIHIYI